MKNIVSFETAKRLKDAGFPQPEFDTGQFWYNQYKAITFVGRWEVPDGGVDKSFCCMSVSSGRTDKIVPVKHDAFFAPTATDILEQLTDHVAFYYVVGLSEARRCWQCIGFSIFDHPEKYWFAENPAEAAALAWLEINEKKWYDKIEIVNNDVLPGTHVK